MAKDYAKFVPPKARMSRKKQRRRGIILICFLVLLSVVAIVSYAIYQKNTNTSSPVGNPKMAVWFSKMLPSFHHKQDNKIPAKTLPKVAVLDKPSPPPIHFDFYNELPNMQMVRPSVADDAPVVAKTIARTPSETPAQSMFNPEDISSLLSAEKTESQYIVQLGVFENEQAANRLLTVLSLGGNQAEVIEINQDDHTVYRVQLGPYSSKELAKLSQQRLQKLGVPGMVRQL